MRFYFLYPERRTPGGGHKQIRLLAHNLRRLGECSLLLREELGFDDSGFYGIHVPTAPFTTANATHQLSSDDILVVPEYDLGRSLALARDWVCRKAVYVQGGFLALHYRPQGGYANHGIEFMIGVSPYIIALGQTYLGMDRARVFHVPYPVVRGPFADATPPPERKRLSVAYMPRKLPAHVNRIREIVARRHPEVPWLEIDNVPEREVAKRLSENAIFFSTQNGEGFGLPAAEAMSRGCVVTGYRGTGLFPHPYATPLNGLWAPDRSIWRAARRACQAVDVVRGRDTQLHRLLEAARTTAARFSDGAALEALADVVRCVKNGAFDGAPATKHRLGLMGHLQAWRTLQVSWWIRNRNLACGVPCRSRE